MDFCSNFCLTTSPIRESISIKIIAEETASTSLRPVQLNILKWQKGPKEWFNMYLHNHLVDFGRKVRRRGNLYLCHVHRLLYCYNYNIVKKFWANPFEIHTPVEDLPFVFHRGSVIIKWIDIKPVYLKVTCPLCNHWQQWLNLPKPLSGSRNFMWKCAIGLIHLAMILPLWKVYSKLPQGVYGVQME